MLFFLQRVNLNDYMGREIVPFAIYGGASEKDMHQIPKHGGLGYFWQVGGFLPPPPAPANYGGVL